MYTIFKYNTIISPPQIIGYYNFPAFNTYRRIIFQTLYNSKLLSLELLQKMLNHFSFPKLDIFSIQKSISFCPCSFSDSLAGDNIFLNFYLNTDYPQTLQNPIERDFIVTIFPPDCSLKFLRCFNGLDCSSFSNFQFTYDLFFINNNNLTFGSSYELSISNPEYTFIFVYLPNADKNLAFILFFPSTTHRVIKAEHTSFDIYINDEYFHNSYISLFPTAEYFGGAWLHQGDELSYPNHSFSQDEFNPIKRF